MGKRIYLVRILEENIIWKRHLDQLIKAGDFYGDPEQELNTYEREKKTLMRRLKMRILKVNGRRIPWTNTVGKDQ